MAHWLLLDLDYPGAATAWDEAGLPAPTFVAVNPVNGHAQIGYSLASPVCTTPKGRAHPVRYLAAIEAAYVCALKADACFTGPLSKNPLHPTWLLWEPANAPQYELSVLAEYVPELPKYQKGKRKSEKQSEWYGVGRNCTLFDDLSVWAYKAIRSFWRPRGEDAWREAVLAHAEALNVFVAPLPFSEVRSIARSVARWTWRHLTPQGFRARQAAVGAMKGKAKRDLLLAQAEEMHGQGSSNKAIAKALGVSAPTIANWFKR